MKRTTTAMLGAALFVSLAALAGIADQSAPAVSSREALDVLSRMIGAMGGRKALEAVKDTTVSGRIEVSSAGQTLAGALTIYQKEPDKLRVDVTFPEYNISVVQAFDGQTGRFTNPQTGMTEEMPDDIAKDIARQARGSQAILDPRKAGVVYALKPKAAIDGTDYIVLEQAHPDGHRVIMYLDPATHLPYKTQSRALDMMGGEVEAESFATDYRKAGALTVAHAVRVLHNGVEARRITITSVAYNADLDDALFILK